MALPGRASPGLQFSVAVRTLRDEDAAVTLDQIAAGATSRCLLGWISLMRGGATPGIIEQWKQVASQEPNSQHRATYGAIVTVFAELTNCAALWKSGLEGWDMRESTIVAEWKAEGRAEGIAKGRAEGRAEGMAQGKRGRSADGAGTEVRCTDPRRPDVDHRGTGGRRYFVRLACPGPGRRIARGFPWLRLRGRGMGMLTNRSSASSTTLRPANGG